MVAATTATAPNEVDKSYAHTDAKEYQNLLAATANGEIKRRMVFTAVHDFASLIDGAGETAEITGCNGVKLGDPVSVGFSLDLQDMLMTAYVSADDVIQVRLQNESTATVNLASGTLTCVVDGIN